jgi:hypothetical protein
MITLNKDECENLLDALREWEDVVGCKDCEIYSDEEGYDPDDEEQQCVGLDSDRYRELVAKLESCDDRIR